MIYHDGQFDDARLAVHLALTLAGLGGTPLNYLQVTGLVKSGGLTSGVTVRDLESGRDYLCHARVVINATGVFSDQVRRLDDPAATPVIAPSQGVHLVLDRSFLPGDSAVMIPHTADNRVLFAVPWHGRVVVGTTDTPVDTVSLEPRPLDAEIDFLLSHAARYLVRHPARSDVLSTFAGLRPLIHHGGAGETALLSREHVVLLSSSGLVTIAGGKWTTYRRMGEDAVNQAAVVAGLAERPSVSAGLRLHGWQEQGAEIAPWDGYGADARWSTGTLPGKPRLGRTAPPGSPLPGRRGCLGRAP